MVALKRFFHAEKGHGLLSAEPGDQDKGSRCPTMTDGQSAASSVVGSYPSPPHLTVSQSVDADQDTDNVEKYAGKSRDYLQARPLTSCSQAPSRTSSRLTGQVPRHIDLLDALFTSHRYQIESAKTLSPTTPYNEDIAERNMTKFLRGQSNANVYSRLVSALCQEDVASRNIDKGRKSGRSFPRLNRRAPADARDLSRTPSNPQSRKRDANGHNDSRRKDRLVAREESSRSVSHSLADEPDAVAREQWRRCNHYLRPQISEPNLSTESDVSETPVQNPVGHLGVPPAYKEGNRLSRLPMPDSPTIPIPPRRDKNTNESKLPPKSPPDRTSSLNSTNASPSSSPGSTPRRNIRDLSINTDLAARGKPGSRIAHRAIQPPTPSSLDPRQNPSIAEVMNSPLPAASPISASSFPVSNEKLAEMMDLFKQAHASAQAINTHTTFETLQDAIIREVNSHEAFRRVPVPEPGPPFTPAPTQDSFAGSSNSSSVSKPVLSRSVSAKEGGQLSKLIRRGSFTKGHKRNSESRKSISSVLPKGSDKLLRFAPGSTRRRRHTDAPLPSSGFFDADGSKQQATPSKQDNQVTYMDLLMHSSTNTNQSTPPHRVPARTSNPEPRNLSRSQSAMSLSTSQKVSDRTPSVYYLRAQSSTHDYHPNHIHGPVEDSDDEVIHLPSSSVETPRAQVHGIDKNNVQYVVNNSTPRDAYRLMNWPRKHRASDSSEESPIFSGTSSFPLPPLSRPGQQLRNSRSMDP